MLRSSFEDLEGALGEVEEAAPAGTGPAPSRKRAAAERDIAHLSAYLPRIEQVIEPAITLCPWG